MTKVILSIFIFMLGSIYACAQIRGTAVPPPPRADQGSKPVVVVTPPVAPQSTPPNVVIVYEQFNYVGRSRTLGIGKYRLTSPSDLNDFISSVKIGSDVMLIVAETAIVAKTTAVTTGDRASSVGQSFYGTGIRQTLLQNTPDLSKLNLNDKISYLEVVSKKTNPASQTGYKWVEGKWTTVNGQYTWVAGHWTKSSLPPAPNRVEVPLERLPNFYSKYADLNTFEQLSNFWDFIPLGTLNKSQVNNTFRKAEIKENGRYTYFVNKLILDSITLRGNCDHIIVTDTIVLSGTRPKLNANQQDLGSSGTISSKRTYLKIVANHVVQQGKVVEVNLKNLSLTGNNNNGELYVSAETISTSLPGTTIVNLSNLFVRPGLASTMPFACKVLGFGAVEKRLMNYWVVRSLEHLLTLLNTGSSNPDQKWQKDQLYNRFVYLKSLYDVINGVEKDRFNQHVGSLENHFKFEVSEVRALKLPNNQEVDILVQKTENQGLKYVILPEKTLLKPLMIDGKQFIGSIQANSIGDPNYKLSFDLELKANAPKYQLAAMYLRKYGLSLDSTISSSSTLLKAQGFKLKNSTITGKVFPISNQLLKVEVFLPKESRTLIDLFPSNQSNQISLEFSPSNSNVLNRYLAFNTPESLLTNLVQSSYSLENNFDATIISDPFMDYIKLVSTFSASKMVDDSYAPLDFVELSLEIKSPDSIKKKGPYRLSFQHSIAAEQLVYFLRPQSQYDVIISGVASYGNGAFLFNLDNILADQQIMLIHEGHLK